MLAVDSMTCPPWLPSIPRTTDALPIGAVALTTDAVTDLAGDVANARVVASVCSTEAVHGCARFVWDGAFA